MPHRDLNARTVDVVAATRRERLDLCDALDGIDGDAWSTPSLCDGWTVHEVVAHVATSTRTEWRDMVVGMVRHGFDFDRMTQEQAVRLAQAHDPDTLGSMIRETAGSDAHVPGATATDQLLDTIVHAQDVTRPVGRHHPVDPRHGAVALDHALDSRWYGARDRLADLALDATDAPWSGATGRRVVRGPLVDLLLVATGRPAGLAALSGGGLELLTRRLPPTHPTTPT